MANKITQTQPKSRYLEAANSLTPLTMLTAAEAKTLSTAGQEQIGSNEELIYKYRDEFLHIQRAAEQGLTSIDILIDDPNELSIVATAWGFTCTVLDKFAAKIVYRKNLGQEQIERKLSNINIDWSKPKRPTVDVDYYRQSGNLVQLDDSTISIPLLTKVDLVKNSLGLQVTGIIPAIGIVYDVGSAVFGGVGKNIARGIGAVLTLGISEGFNYSVGNITNGGSGYRAGETITVRGADLFGGSPFNNAVFTILEVDNFGSITRLTVSGRSANTNATLQIKLTSAYTAAITILTQIAG